MIDPTHVTVQEMAEHIAGLRRGGHLVTTDALRRLGFSAHEVQRYYGAARRRAENTLRAAGAVTLPAVPVALIDGRPA